ncbi:arabinan endo-1,5-alpha-L-arabinosidase [Cellulomonas sp. SLBN-39]|uniref:arabinan endo-1,5-alpha-L-arabinosidase n=1 Tax=Cellulomonas sp. SLBN-39 TaxID=2768446 RepID=UPI00114F9E0F|nr:arabinan endo-1,5-alpha-L-arabinosidase [Cellulomonas sp. SLBN-39]TQL03276.1 arabinan endo-1,5-alpha-L-arabinosidase [Cellulomonas sp. SLBN-39]
MTTTDPAPVLDTTGWGAEHTHDPTAVRDDDGTYWLFSTDACSDGPVRGGVQVRRSPDLVTWELHGWALPGVPPAAAAWTGAHGLWAPEVVRVGDEWRMYWSASSFGSRTSAIGLAVAPHPAGPWEDRGLVVTSTHPALPEGVSPHGDGSPNAIDANVVVDGDRHWLVYGSFFGGLHALELDPATGLVDGCRPGEPSPGPGVLLVRRPAAVEGAVEGPYVLPRPGGGWAMLASWDSLFTSYHLRAAVAPAVTGPWTDRTGLDLRTSVAEPPTPGTVVLAGHRLPGGPGLRAPGHASVLTEPARDGHPGRQLLVHHVRDDDAPERHRVQVRRLVWTRDGWPLVSPQPWAGDARETDDETAWPDDVAALAGTWELLEPGACPRTVQDARTGTLDLVDPAAHGSGRFSWRTADGAHVEAVVAPAWDAVRDRATTVVLALDERGRVTAGTRTPDA